MGNLTIKPASGGLLKLQDAGSTDRIQITDGGSTVLYEDDGNAALTIDTDGYTQIASGKRIETDEIRAQGVSGLKLYDDGGAGIFVEDGGQVGIGTTSPGKLLEVYGDVFINDDGADPGRLYVGDGSNYWFQASEIATYSRLDFITNNGGQATRMTILSTGLVGIGDTTPSYQLELSTNSAAKPTSTLWTVPSDERLKNNIELADLDICYDVVKNLPLKRYTWKDDVYTEKQTNDRSVLGWIAQDVKTVFPKSVKENNFKGISNNDGVSAVEAQEKLEWTDKPTDENTKDEIKAWMDSNSLEYNSDDTKADLIAKIPELKQEAIEAVEAIEETFKLEIEDCLSIDADQIFRAMFGAIQKLQTKVEALENA